MEKPLVNKKLKMERYPGKGGWTYVTIPQIKQDSKRPFGFVKVKGSIDDYVFNQYNLMPMSNGKLFLPVKAAIRKQIKKQAGDWVKVVLYADNDPVHIPGELLECLRDEPIANNKFHNLTDGRKKEYINWIYAAKKDTTRAARIASVIDQLVSKNNPDA